MKVELSIKDDKEIKDLIKDMIRGTVTSIIRTELKEMAQVVLADETKKLMVKISTDEVRKQVNIIDTQRAIREAVRSCCTEQVDEKITAVAYEYLRNQDKAIKEVVEKHMKSIKISVG